MPAQAQPKASGSTRPVVTGAARLAADNFTVLRGKRVGVLTNHTGRVGEHRLVDLIASAPGVELAAILAPEHGLSGTAEAGAKVASGRDATTGVRIHSLYGSAYKPTPQMLAGLDLLIFDMQDIGARFYTYISTMGLCMQAAAAAGLPLMVLDRPNPLGGDNVSGFMLEKPFASFVGRFEIPIAHGLTVAELARMAKGERLLPGLEKLDLQVIALEGWRRTMRWPDTGLPWIATSPNIPTFGSALAYAGTGLFEATTASEGRGTEAPFLKLGHPEIGGEAIATAVAAAKLPGVRFAPIRFTPNPIPGVATSPRFSGRAISGVRIDITDAARYRPLEVGIHLLSAFDRALRSHGNTGLVTDTKAFHRLAGTARLLDFLQRGASPNAIIANWQGDVDGFNSRRSQYLLYT